MDKSTNNTKTRKPYRKPQIEQVRLVPEEAVLAGCKNNNGAGPPNTIGCAPAGPSCSVIAS